MNRKIRNRSPSFFPKGVKLYEQIILLFRSGVNDDDLGGIIHQGFEAARNIESIELCRSEVLELLIARIKQTDNHIPLLCQLAVSLQLAANTQLRDTAEKNRHLLTIQAFLCNIIYAIAESGGKKAVAALPLLGDECDPLLNSKALESLKKIDHPDVVGAIRAITAVNYHQKMRFQNIRFLNAMVDLHERIKSGRLNNISQKDIRRVVEEQSAALLDIKKMLGWLDEATTTHLDDTKEKKRSGYSYDYKPASEEAIAELRAAFVRVDAAEITEKKYTPLFDAVVNYHRKNKKAEADLVALMQRTLG